jgi:hypothetical protein
MGDRGQVQIKLGGKDKDVYLYTHWDATGLIETVKKALTKKWRWDDPEYLARIIFDEMVGKDQGEETGFGIGTAKHGDIWRLIIVDVPNNKISIQDDGKNRGLYSFDDFIDTDSFDD